MTLKLGLREGMLSAAIFGGVMFALVSFDPRVRDQPNVSIQRHWLLTEADVSFNPREIAEMAAAFESTLAALNLVDRSDPITTLIARIIIDCAKQGEIERVRLHDCALEAITKH